MFVVLDEIKSTKLLHYTGFPFLQMFLAELSGVYYHSVWAVAEIALNLYSAVKSQSHLFRLLTACLLT